MLEKKCEGVRGEICTRVAVEYCITRCDAVQSSTNVPMFRGNLLSTSPTLKIERTSS
jgi:hypothetical protein